MQERLSLCHWLWGEATKPPLSVLFLGGRDVFRAAESLCLAGDVLPPVGSVRMSYARFLDLMNQRRVKRVSILGDGAVAIVEVPVEGWASDNNDVKHDRRDPEYEAPGSLPSPAPIHATDSANPLPREGRAPYWHLDPRLATARFRSVL